MYWTLLTLGLSTGTVVLWRGGSTHSDGLGLEDDRAAEDDVRVDERDKALQILSLHGCSPLAGDRTTPPAYHAC